MKAEIAPALRVVQAGALSTIQDAGRRGVSAMGVSPSGAADWFSARAANRLVGNEGTAALVETTLTGASFELLRGASIAVTGAEAALEIAGREARPWQPYEVNAHERVAIGAARRGLRSYLAVRGGISVKPVFGSASTDVGAGLGGFEGRRLKSGDILHVAVGLAPTVAGIYSGALSSLASCEKYLNARINSRDYVTLRVLPGPHAHPQSADLLGRTYRVSHQSTRQALRLDGNPLAPTANPEIISAGVCAGCIQLTPDGLPIVLLAEHQTTGGYASVFCVCTADLPLAAQARPGASVRFALITQVEASLALKEALTALA